MLDAQKMFIFREKLRQYREHMLNVHHDMDSDDFEEFFLSEVALRFQEAKHLSIKVRENIKALAEQYIQHKESKAEQHKNIFHGQSKEEAKEQQVFSTIFEDIMDDLFSYNQNQVTENDSVFNRAYQGVTKAVNESVLTIKTILSDFLGIDDSHDAPKTNTQVTEKVSVFNTSNSNEEEKAESKMVTFANALSTVIDEDIEKKDEKAPASILPESVNNYLHQFDTSTNENTNRQNQEMDIG